MSPSIAIAMIFLEFNDEGLETGRIIFLTGIIVFVVFTNSTAIVNLK